VCCIDRLKSQSKAVTGIESSHAGTLSLTDPERYKVGVERCHQTSYFFAQTSTGFARVKSAVQFVSQVRPSKENACSQRAWSLSTLVQA